MKKILLFLAIISILLFVTVGCKSDPELAPVETPVEEVPPVEPIPEPEPEPIPEPMPEPEPLPQETEISEEELLSSATKAAENAKTMKEKIESLSLQGYNENSYNSGLSALESYNALVAENASATEKLEKATLAEKEFTEVLNSAFSKLASEKKSEVNQIRKKALEIKSDKADKVGYEAAQLLFTTADEYIEVKNYESGYNYFVKALEAFDDVYNNVSAKRQAALEAIERAKNKADNVDEFAAEADKIAPLSTESDNQGEE
jgi:hypothetical protein